MTTTAARRSAHAASLLAAAGLSWSGAHLLSLRLADPHAHMHEHGLAHGRVGDGQQALVALHSYLGPAALLSALVLAAALATLRLLPAAGRTRLPAARVLPLTAATSAGVFVLVETAEHAVATHRPPPLALLVVGVLVHACGGLAAATLVRVLPTDGPPLPSPAAAQPPSPAVRLLTASRPRRLRPRALLSVLAGRAPPLSTAAPQPS